jgi:thiol-disulfide isomerase/thioredoxin
VKTTQLAVIIVLALTAGVIGFVAYQATQKPPVSESTASNSLPQFVLPDLEGVERTSSEWSGRPRIVNFWATWCPPCRREIPLLIELQAQYGDALQVIGIAIDDMAEVQDYAADTGFNYPVLVGQQNAVELGNAVLRDWIGLPFTAFVDAAGQITHVHVGELHRDQAQKFLKELL